MFCVAKVRVTMLNAYKDLNKKKINPRCELPVVRSPRDPNPQNLSITLFITGVFEKDWRAKITKRYNLMQGKILLDNYLQIYRSSYDCELC
jgi:hypothetical protein